MPRVSILVALILLAQWIVSLAAVNTKGITTDEPAHLVGGLAMWQRDDYRFNPENGNLPQRIAALPAWLADVRLPPSEDDNYRGGDVWMTAYRATFETEGQNLRGPLMAGRALIAFFGVGVSLMVYLSARSLWGEGGGLFALVLCAACPNLLAHSALATSDAASAFCLPLAAWLYWRMLEAPSARRICLASAGLGLACVSKFSAVLLAPAFFLLLAIHAWRHRGGAPWKRLVCAQFILVFAAWAVIWASFGFQHAPGGPEGGTYFRNWGYALGPEDSVQRVTIGHLRERPVFPEAFVYGAGYVASSAAYRLNYFMGELRETGTPGFFPYLFLVKTPPATLLAIFGGAISAFLLWRQRRPGFAALAPWAVWGLVYGAAALASKLNIGHRHLLPLYPCLFILCGALWPALRGRARLLVPALAAGTVATAAYSFPHYIAYFNPLDGGPSQAWRKVVDSSLDWGQDLPALEAWLQENRKPTEALYQSYFGCDEPAAYAINAIELPRAHHFRRTRPWYELHGGLYIISASMMQVELRPWNAASEAAYPRRRAIVAALLSNQGIASREEFTRELSEIEHARAKRLAAYLRRKEPVATPGFSQLVFRLTEEEARKIDLGAALSLDLAP